MFKYLLIGSLIFSYHGMAARSFNGGYAGVGLAYSYTKVDINNQTYKAKTPYFSMIGGWGRTDNKLYYGFEGTLDSDQFSKKKDGKKLTKKFGLSAGVRIGRVIQENFLPYFKLGIRWDRYTYKKALPDNQFTSWMAVPTVGVDAFVEDWFLIRSEVEYSIGFANAHATKVISRKPKTFLVRAGALLKF